MEIETLEAPTIGCRRRLQQMKLAEGINSDRESYFLFAQFFFFFFFLVLVMMEPFYMLMYFVLPEDILLYLIDPPYHQMTNGKCENITDWED